MIPRPVRHNLPVPDLPARRLETSLRIARAPMNRPNDSVLMDALESRVLLAGFTAKVDFHPSAAAGFKGYVSDTGAVYGNRAKSLVFGWSSNNPTLVDSNFKASPSQRYDTFAMMHKGKKPLRWEIGVPDGLYSVRIVSGDPKAFNSTHRINAEGVSVINGATTRKKRFLSGRANVVVTDGRLTVAAAKGARRSAINFIEISQVLPTVSVSALDASAAEAGLGAGSFRFTRTGPTDKSLTISFVVSGS